MILCARRSRTAAMVALAIGAVSVFLGSSDVFPSMREESLLVLASNGVVRLELEGGRWSRKLLPVPQARRRLLLAAEARDRGTSVVDLSDSDLVRVSRQLDSLRALDETSWAALAMASALRLDSSLASGYYRFIVVSDGRSHVLLRRDARDGIRIASFARAPGEKTEAFLLKRGLRAKEGYALAVSELPAASASRARSAPSLDQLLLRLRNRPLARSGVLERLIPGRRAL
jgi:hypothetical protein